MNDRQFRTWALAVLMATGVATFAVAAAAAPARPAGTPAAFADSAATDSSARGAPAEPARFRVDMHFFADGERRVMRRYVNGPRTRMEMEAEGRKMVTIELGDTAGTMYTIAVNEKRAMKMTRAATERMAARMGQPIEDEANAAPETAPHVEGRLESLRDTTLDGRAVDRYRVSYPEGAGFMWVERATQLPVRFEAQGAVIEMRNYDFGEQPESLYQPPRGYQLVDVDELMKKMGAGGPMAMPRSLLGGMKPGELPTGDAGDVGGMRMPPGMPATGALGGMAQQQAGRMGGELGGQLGASVGASVGGPLGAMIGQYVGQRLGTTIGQRAAKAVVGGR